MLWTFHCFDPHAGAVLKGDQVATAGHTLSAKEVRWVDVPQMFPQALLQINPLVFRLCSASEMFWTCLLLWNAFIGKGCHAWLGRYQVLTLNICQETVFQLQISVLLNLSSPFLVALLTFCCEKRPVYTVSWGISTKQTRDCCVYHWVFSVGLSLQLNFWWQPLHLFTLCEKVHISMSISMSVIYKCIHIAMGITGSLAHVQLLC